MAVTHQSSILYRPEIDGLRALAVSAVVLFHLSKDVLPAGYLGVDIFFTISGFLIARIVSTDVHNNIFSLVDFYRRRIRRILPVLACVLISTTIVALVLLLPSDLIGFAKSLISSIFFFSNIYFWRDTNYFSPNAETKPLLHIWSLSLEEQFYLIFPTVLVFGYRIMGKRSIFLVLSLTLVSYCLYVFLNNIGGASPAFFLLPTRAWQLGAGACAGLLPIEFLNSNSRLKATLALLAGSALFIIISGITQFHTVVLATLVTFAAVTFLLTANAKENFTGRFFSSPFFIWVGKRSFSLYLWHWPIIVFYRYYLVRELLWQDMIVCAVLTWILAAFSYSFVEERFRIKSISFQIVGSSLVGAGALLCGVAFVISRADGFPQRLPADAASINEAVGAMYRCPVADYINIGLVRGCNLNMHDADVDKADVVLMGNSHALMYSPVWSTVLSRYNRRGILLNVNACLPTVSANISTECVLSARQMLEAVLAKPNIQTVIIGMTWWHQATKFVKSDGTVVANEMDIGLVSALDDLIDKINSKGKKIILIGPIAQPGFDIASTLSRQKAFGWKTADAEISRKNYERDLGSAKAHFRTDNRIIFVEPDKIQCHENVCDLVIGDRSLFADESHIAKAELYRYVDIFDEALRTSDHQTLESSKK